LRLGLTFDEVSTGLEDIDADNSRHLTRLVMNLKSRLDLLKDFKELRVVDLHNMLAGINEPAVQE
ncbi:hypothetical protein BGX24_000840, partial [Mortierella sp. AD032]